jgi:16S rRNA (cytidine1402-2'-O)-methyltransferase
MTTDSHSGALILLGNLLGAIPIKQGQQHFSPAYIDAISKLDGLIAESDKSARHFLSYFREHLKIDAHRMPLALFHKKVPKGDIPFLLEPALNGQVWGYVTDSGLPCVADPGHLLVRHARKNNLKIDVHMGPVSILWALMLSGFPGNRFMFHGYLAKEPRARKKEIEGHIRLAKEHSSVQIFIEAPYRNEALLETMLETLPDNAILAVVVSLMLPEERALVMPVSLWKTKLSQKTPELDGIRKEPAVMLFMV